MSEQPHIQQSAQEYQVPSMDGIAPMDTNTDIWLKASELPLRPVVVEQVRPMTEAEITAEKVRKASIELKNLNVVRLGAMRNEDKPMLREAA